MLFYIILLIMCIYAAMVVIGTVHWVKLPEESPTSNAAILPVALVVCCRNEAQHLPQLLQSVRNQTRSFAQIVLIDDHSTDETPVLMQQFATTHDSAVCVMQATEYGKKRALREAIASVTTDIVLCTDGDCVLPPDLVLLVGAHFAQHRDCALLVGGVRMHPATSFFQHLQAVEFGSLVAAGAAAVAAGYPVLCNGANLAFRRTLWHQAQTYLHDEEPSGDDIFLLQYTKRVHARIDTLKSPDGFVDTIPTTNIRAFMNQRCRWASKSRSYTDSFTIFTACMVLGIALLLAVLSIGAFFSTICAWSLCFLFVSKLLIDSILLIKFFRFSRQSALCRYIVPAAVLYPFYIVAAAIGGLFHWFGWK